MLLSQLSIFADSVTPQFSITKQRIDTQESISDYAISANGQYLLVVRKQSQILELLNATDFSLIKSMPIPKKEMAQHNKKIDFIYNAVSRQSFIIGMGSSNLIWEILYEENPLPVYNGLMHDYRMSEGLVKDESDFPVRIIKPASRTNIPISSYYFYPVSGLFFIARDKKVEVIQLDARQTIATITLEQIPNLAVSSVNILNDTPHLLVPFLNKSGVTSINMNSWTVTETK